LQQQVRKRVIRSLRIEDRCFVELRCSVCSRREICKDLWGRFMIRSGAQKLVGALGVQSLSRGGGDLRVVAGGERDENLKQIVLRQWQETARRCETAGCGALPVMMAWTTGFVDVISAVKVGNR
jgi:hypothetical protein